MYLEKLGGGPGFSAVDLGHVQGLAGGVGSWCSRTVKIIEDLGDGWLGNVRILSCIVSVSRAPGDPSCI